VSGPLPTLYTPNAVQDISVTFAPDGGVSDVGGTLSEDASGKITLTIGWFLGTETSIAPGQLSVTITDSSGATVAQLAGAPTAMSYRPNGDGCPPVCQAYLLTSATPM
jgi:hypothetical protein